MTALGTTGLPQPVRSVSGVDPFRLPLRVLHVWQPDVAGVPRYAQAAARFQAEHGWLVHVAGPDPEQAPGVTVHDWRAARNPLRGVRAESAALREILAAARADVVVAHSAKAGLVVRGTLRGAIPTVFVPHAWSHLALPAPAQPAALAWERVAARWTNAVVAVGDAEAAEGVRRRIRAPMFVVRNPVPPGWRTVSAAERQAARQQLGLGPGPVAVCVGRLSRQKGQDLLLTAWASVIARVPAATLVLVGDGPSRAELEPGAPQSVRFVGATGDPRPYLAAADVAVLPSRWEGLSLSMLEAMASGRSVVTTAVAGSEVVAAAAAGAVVPVEDVAALADALGCRLDRDVDPAEEGARGQAHVRRHHDFATQMTRLAAVITRAHAFGR